MRGADHLPGVDMVPVLTAADIAARNELVTPVGAPAAHD
jgi:hypothetical protein